MPSPRKNNKSKLLLNNPVDYHQILSDLHYTVGDDFSIPSSSRRILRVRKDDRRGIAYFTNPKYKKSKYQIIDEIEVLKTIKSVKNNDHFPALHEYSKNQGWFIREEIDGHNAGNVYFFNDNFSRSHANLVQIVKILQDLAEITPPKHRKLSASNFLVEIKTIKSILPVDVLEQKAINNYLTEIEKSKAVFDQNLGFLHFDIQPTNLLLASDGLKLIDFEKARSGNKLFDFVSIWHRFSKKESVQSILLNQYKEMIDEPDPLAMKLFSKYLQIIDITSLYYSYIIKTSPPYHGTNIGKAVATDLMNLYIKKFHSISII